MTLEGLLLTFEGPGNGPHWEKAAAFGLKIWKLSTDSAIPGRVRVTKKPIIDIWGTGKGWLLTLGGFGKAVLLTLEGPESGMLLTFEGLIY